MSKRVPASMRPKTTCSFRVRMKRSATLLVSTSDEGEAGRHAEERQLVLEAPGIERAAVVATQQHAPARHRLGRSRRPPDGHCQRFGGGVTIAVPGDVPAEAPGFPSSAKVNSVTLPRPSNDGAVGVPRDVGRIGGDTAVVFVGHT